MTGEFGGELGEECGTVIRMAGTIAGIAVEQRCREGFVRGEAVVNERSEHLLITEVGFEVFVGCRARIRCTTEKVKAVCGGLCGKIRVLQKQLGVERSRSHLLAMERLRIAPVVGLVLVTIGGFVDAE